MNICSSNARTIENSTIQIHIKKRCWHKPVGSDIRKPRERLEPRVRFKSSWFLSFATCLEFAACLRCIYFSFLQLFVCLFAFSSFRCCPSRARTTDEQRALKSLERLKIVTRDICIQIQHSRDIKLKFCTQFPIGNELHCKAFILTVSVCVCVCVLFCLPSMLEHCEHNFFTCKTIAQMMQAFQEKDARFVNREKNAYKCWKYRFMSSPSSNKSRSTIDAFSSFILNI